MKALEVNFDGLVGPTHHYAGLSLGNLASTHNAYKISRPKEAALQGLKKMHLLMTLGIPQAVFPPHERPFMPILKNLGFSGTESTVLKTVYQKDPELFTAIYSASSMWTANSATVCPSRDSKDGRVHFTPANLVTHLHRAIEAEENYNILKSIFSDPKHFLIHPPLFSHLDFADEGAANHHRFCKEYEDLGLHLFVYGRKSGKKHYSQYRRFHSRQTLEASESIIRLHQIDPLRIVYVKQNPKAVDEGVFHNDVISFGNKNVFLYHTCAFQNKKAILASLKKKIDYPLYLLPVSSSELSVKLAVKSYLFNSQLVSLNNEKMALIAPIESQKNMAAFRVLKRILEADNPIQSVHFVDCIQSMQNGGGPACLRLRVVLTEEELKACKNSVFLNEVLYDQLVNWVQKHYRDSLNIKDLIDPMLQREAYMALDELTQILKLGTIYHFQKA